MVIVYIVYFGYKIMISTQNGFALLELMIVLAIIGILAVVAVPAYSDYTGRAQVMEGFKLSDNLRQEVAIWVWQNRTFPNTAAVAEAGVIGGQAVRLKGKYIDAGGVSVMADTGVIRVRFSRGMAANQTLELQPTINMQNETHLIEWHCGGQIDVRFLPHSCR